MDRLIVFGIGGSGERVMRSLVMLLAGGMEMNCKSIQPVLIDSDEKSKALKNVFLLYIRQAQAKYQQTKTILQRQKATHQDLQVATK